MNITFRQVDVFQTVVTTGSVTETASRLGISQPAVSRLLADLEREVGFKLFSRTGRLLSPTIEARQLADEVRRTLSGLERIKAAAREIRDFQHARLCIVTSPAFASLIAPLVIRRFTDRFPDVILSLEIQSSDDTVEWMVSQHYGIGIAPPASHNPLLHSQPLFAASAVCIVPRTHRLAGRRLLQTIDLAGERFVSYMPDAQFRYVIDRVFESAGIERVLQFEARTTDAISQLVAEELGVAIVGAIDRERAAALELAVIPFNPALPFEAALIWSRHGPLSGVTQAFIEMFQRGLDRALA